MQPMKFDALLSFYEDQLFENFLSFWMKRGIDEEKGGFFTCFTNRGDKLLHPYKFCWSQGRFVWMLARAAREFGASRPRAEVARWEQAAARGAEFLMKYSRLPDGTCSFILSRDGEPILLNPDGTARKAAPGESYHTSIYVDFFVIYGLAEYAMLASDRRAFDFAADLCDQAVARFYSTSFRSDPYPVPAGYRVHGRPMIIMETLNEMAQAAEHFKSPRAADYLKRGGECIAEVLDDFMGPDNLIREMKSDDPSVADSMLCRYINPGHMIEDAWFIIHLAQRLGLPEREKQALKMMLAATKIGWDKQYGGLPQYLDYTGASPKGSVPASLEKDEMINKLRNNWDTKLWWPHSEALYGLLLGYELTRDQEYLDWYWRMHEYSFKTFPNPDKSIGEWIHIRDRQGNPIDKIVALPVKDPFHITRAFIWTVKVLQRLSEK